MSDEQGEPSTALFSLQVCVDAVSFHRPVSAPGHRSTPLAEWLLAFQLLQFDIVLFDDDPQLQLPQPQGRSCLFECDPQRLSQAIRDDESTALVLLVLQREDQKARLQAFACVRLELPHLAFTEETKRPRVSEWVAVETTWPLVNHQNQSVGSVTGSVTLACLGGALAPHLMIQRFGRGMHVLGKPSSPRAALSAGGSVDEATSQADEARASGGSARQHDAVSGTVTHDSEYESCELTAPSPKKAAASSPRATLVDQRRDAAVQCSESEDENGSLPGVSSPKPILMRGHSRDRASRSSGQRVVDELDRLKIGPRGIPRQLHRAHDRSPRHTYISYSRETSRQRGDDAVAAVAQLPDLPPPLFFHKPKHQQR